MASSPRSMRRARVQAQAKVPFLLELVRMEQSRDGDIDEADVSHGFVRDRRGAIVEFDVPGAGTGPGQGPQVFGIAPSGAVTGGYLDSDNVFHGFVRQAHGVGLASPEFKEK